MEEFVTHGVSMRPTREKKFAEMTLCIKKHKTTNKWQSNADKKLYRCNCQILCDVS